MSVVNEPVKDGVRKSGIGNAPVPLVNRNLGGNQGGRLAEAVIQDFEDVLRILDGNRIPHPVIEDQQAAPGEGTQGCGEGTIGADLGKRVQQTGGAVVTHSETIADGCLAKCGSYIYLTRSQIALFQRVENAR